MAKLNVYRSKLVCAQGHRHDKEEDVRLFQLKDQQVWQRFSIALVDTLHKQSLKKTYDEKIN